MHSLRFMRCRPHVRRPAASGRRGPLRLHSKAPHRSPSLRLSSRYALRSMPPIGRHPCALRSRRRAPANGSGDVAVSPDARLQPRVGAATPEHSSGSRSRSPRLSRGCDTLRLASGMPGSTLYVQSHLGIAALRRRCGPNDRLRDRSGSAQQNAPGPLPGAFCWALESSRRPFQHAQRPTPCNRGAPSPPTRQGGEQLPENFSSMLRIP